MKRSFLSFSLFALISCASTAYAGRIEAAVEVLLLDTHGRPVQDWAHISIWGMRERVIPNPYFPPLPSHSRAPYEAVSYFIKADSQGRVVMDISGDADGDAVFIVNYGTYYYCRSNDRTRHLTASGQFYSQYTSLSGENCTLRLEGQDAVSRTADSDGVIRMTCILTDVDARQAGRSELRSRFSGLLSDPSREHCTLLQ